MINVKQAELREAYTIVGTPVAGAITISKQKFPCIISLTYDSAGLHVQANNVLSLIPAGNIKGIIVEQEGE